MNNQKYWLDLYLTRVDVYSFSFAISKKFGLLVQLIISFLKMK